MKKNVNELTGTDIIEMLRTNDHAIARALVVLYERQTADEKVTEGTRHHNNVGFRPCHARMGTSMAKFYLRNKRLSPKQIAYWRQEGKQGMRISIYWRQLLDAAHKKAAADLAQKAMEVEREMHKMEAEADLAETIRTEKNMMMGAGA